MQHYWTKLGELKIAGFDVVIEKTWEDISPRDCFDDSVTDIEEICRKIDRYDLDWFMLRAVASYKGIKLGDAYVGGFLYENAEDVMKDGTAEDIAGEAVEEAKKAMETLVLGYISDGSGREPKIIKQETVCL
jgi:hypothetical protein